MGKSARERPTALVSRSGAWLIGGALLLSLAVLAWALQSDTPVRPTRALRRSAPAERAAPRTRPARAEPAAEELAARPPSVADYGPLLQGNAFQPRVVPRREMKHGSPAGHPASAAGGANGSKAARHHGSGGEGGHETVDEWHGWKYNGVAQLDQQTYALMDQPNQKQSRFVKTGDHLEGATVARVAENEVRLRESDGSLVRVRRVDAMAELLRSVRPAAPPPGAAPAQTGPLPATPPPSPGPVTAFPPGSATPQGPSAATAGMNDGAPGASFSRRGRQFQPRDVDDDTGAP